jgi:hypothetical protein
MVISREISNQSPAKDKNCLQRQINFLWAYYILIEDDNTQTPLIEG